MDKICISNLFPTTYKNEPFNVNTLFNLNDNSLQTNKLNFNIKKLITLREERKKKIFVYYDKIFSCCLNKIEMANNMNKTEILYEVPNAIYGSFDYNVHDCIHFINNKLREMKLDTLIINDKTLYVSWINLEENIKK